MASPIAYTTYGTAFTDAVNGVIAELSQEESTRQASDLSLQQQISSVINQLQPCLSTVAQHVTQIAELDAGLSGLQGEIVQNAAVAAGSVSGVQTTAQGANVAAAAAVQAASAATDAVSDLTAALVDVQVTAMLGARPGDSPDLFTVDIYAGISGVPGNGSVVTNTDGRAMRIVGRLPFYGPVGLRAIEPAHVYKVRAALRRIVDTTDTAGDAVHVAVAWYGVDRNLLALAPLLVADDTLTVADGRIERSALISTAPGDPSVLPIPAGAAYLRPFVAAFGDVPTTDVEVIESADVSDAGIVAPDLDAANAAIAALQAQVRALAAAAGVTLS